jgi:hypothetical protein
MQTLITKQIVSEISELNKSNNPYPIAKKISNCYNKNIITSAEYNFLCINILEEVIRQKRYTPNAIKMVKHCLNLK